MLTTTDDFNTAVTKENKSQTRIPCGLNDFAHNNLHKGNELDYDKCIL